ncbi:hypothetical protein [Priestia aryabhattai]|uniref:hypothetical protein n=1 Tax=Priestia aryabhattai TaxID=412384 RepID=UPI0015F3EBDD|nr:hypothetical protein [Priestia aryabhattai]MBZ6483987.1 hypothetical protein [Priestia aryabhattai]
MKKSRKRKYRYKYSYSVQYQSNPSVNVYGIFTPGSAPSDHNGRQNRFNRDIASANQIWNSGEECNINFIPQPIIEVNTVIDVTNLNTNTAFKGPVENLINQVKQMNGNQPGIYVVYTSGNDFAAPSGSSRPIGVGGVIIENFRVENGVPQYTLFGSIALSNRALSTPFAFAHEAGHVLFTQLNNQPVNNVFMFESIDPTGPFIDSAGNVDPAHSNLTGNLMAPILPNNTPTINPLQCQKANMSRIFQNTTMA